ncbi:MULTISPECIES: sensor histidine kinase [unclassified Solwaraspora]|uniref:sensor histidine kinase n=1 Tax=unclassified Solwaraspora TaxID=2627926 RepID=UPI00259B2807|nr:histidine kinase [Solwaraspora sp. WMMA2056]WJK43012.1 histidine kinase [Solwaraspora sp. WMMA2056]
MPPVSTSPDPSTSPRQPTGPDRSTSPYRWTLLDLAVATAVATIAWQYRASLADLVIGLGMAVALVWRRRRPMTVMLVVAGLGAAQLLVALSVPEFYDVAVLIAMAAVVTHADRQWHAVLAGGITLVGVAVLAVDAKLLADDHHVTGLADFSEYAVLMLICVAIWLTAYMLRSRKEQTAVAAERAAAAERERDQLARLAAADERAAIARELHDVVAHSLAVMTVQADGASYMIDLDAEQARKAMITIGDTGRDALEDMRRIVAVLRGVDASPAAPQPGAAGTPDDTDRRRAGIAQLSALIERTRGAGLVVELSIDGDPTRLSPAEELTMFWVVQESLTNTLRYSGPGTAVTVTVRIDADTAELTVIDDGRGTVATRPATAPPATARSTAGPASGGNGLLGMRERVAVHGGEVTAGPRPAGGWQVHAVLPIRSPARAGTEPTEVTS